VLLALLDAFRTAGLTTAELSVRGVNAVALGLYESVGMAPDFRAELWELANSPG
jgi:ribosomal protein S18 acetylase RimI-like enzyme